MAKTELRLVTDADGIHDSIRRFNDGAREHRNRAQSLLAETTYWVHDPATSAFGPSKFVGFAHMNFPSYEAAVRGNADGAAFDGHGTRDAIERAIARKFRSDLSLEAALKVWGHRLLGRDAFGMAQPAKWRFLVLDGRSALDQPTEKITLPLRLHQRYGRGDVFGSVGVEHSSKNQHQNTGLSPRCPDGGFFIFITLNKTDFNPAYDYDDELFADHLRWVTRRDRAEDHAHYVAARSPDTRVSLFIRNSDSEDFAYLGELLYERHRQFTNHGDG